MNSLVGNDQLTIALFTHSFIQETKLRSTVSLVKTKRKGKESVKMQCGNAEQYFVYSLRVLLLHSQNSQIRLIELNNGPKFDLTFNVISWFSLQ